MNSFRIPTMNLFNRQQPTMKTSRAMTHPSPSLHRFFCALWCALLATLLLPTAQAASTVPEFMTYQGFLVDGNGNPLATNAPANYTVIFRIYDAPTGDTTLQWGESQIVTVDRGSFSVQLGEGNAVSGAPRPPLSTVFAGAIPDQRYMELTVTLASGNVTLLPRLRLLPAPYSFTATTASRLVTSNGVAVLETASGRITGDGSGLTGLTAAQIASGTFSSARIPNLDATKITTGTLGINQIPGLPASQITSGVFSDARIPTLDASKITGTFSANQIPNVDGSKITGTLGTAQIPNVDGSKITGTLGVAQIPQNLVAHNFSGNVGIGTTTPGTNRLQVVGSIRMGTGGTNYAVSGVEDLRIVRGMVKGTTASQNLGAGFTVSTFADGVAKINFNTAFSSTPIVTVTMEDTTEPFTVSVNTVRSNSFEVLTRRWDTFPYSWRFHFIAIGPR